MSYRIEKGYGSDDIPQLLELNHRCFEGVERPPDNVFKDMLEMSDVWLITEVGHWVPDDECEFDDKWVNLQVVGFCLVNPATLYIWSMAIAPEHRGKGRGTHMLSSIIQHYSIFAVGRQMTLHCSVNNPAQKLYFDLGFRVHRVIKNHYVTYDGLLMRKQL